MSRASSECEKAGFWPEGLGETDAAFEYTQTLLKEMSIGRSSHRSFDIWCLDMPTPRTSLEARHVAVVRPAGAPYVYDKAPAGCRYFTAEATATVGVDCFCEWTESEHRNYSQHPTMSRDAFMREVVGHLDR